jgi:hypothetical protein
MDMKIEELLVEEMRLLRQEVKEVRSEISSIKIKLASITMFFSIGFGLIGSWLKDKLLN